MFDSTVKKRALNWYGSQWNNAKWILSLWTPHRLRLIPFAGALSEVLRSKPAEIEIACDLNNRLVNFMKVLRDKWMELDHLLDLTIWHEGEFELAGTPHEDPLEDARRFWALTWMSMYGGQNMDNPSFRFTKRVDGRYGAPNNDLTRRQLKEIADRLQNIQFLHRDGFDLFRLFRGNEDALFWIDPPFPTDTRGRKNGYEHEFQMADHLRLAKEVSQCKGAVLINGYWFNKDGSPSVYQELFSAWHAERRPTNTNFGGVREQAIWMNEIAYSRWRSQFLQAESVREHFNRPIAGGIGGTTPLLELMNDRT